MKYAVVIEQGGTSFGAWVPDLPGCIAVGESRKEVIQLIQEAMATASSGPSGAGREIPSPASSVEIIGVAA